MFDYDIDHYLLQQLSRWLQVHLVWFLHQQRMQSTVALTRTLSEQQLHTLATCGTAMQTMGMEDWCVRNTTTLLSGLGPCPIAS